MKSGKYTVDRFEGEMAVLLLRGNEEVMEEMPKQQLPQNVKEGDILFFREDGSSELLLEETAQAWQEAKQLFDRLIRKNQ